MSDKKLTKSPNYSEHFAEFAGFGPAATSKDVVNIHFLSNRLQPAVMAASEADSSGKQELSIGAVNEVTHECTIFMPFQQLKALKLAIEQAIVQIEGQP